MAFKLPKNVVSHNNMKIILYLITLALAVSYVMNRENIALVSLIVVTGIIYMLKKNIVVALGVSIIVTNVLLVMNFFKSFEGFKEGATGKKEEPYIISEKDGKEMIISQMKSISEDLLSVINGKPATNQDRSINEMIREKKSPHHFNVKFPQNVKAFVKEEIIRNRNQIKKDLSPNIKEYTKKALDLNLYYDMIFNKTK